MGRARIVSCAVRIALALSLCMVLPLLAQNDARPRARDLGVAPGVFGPAPLNAITDVDGVTVGQVTLVEGDRIRTGVTAVVPHGGNVFQDKVPAGVFVGNAFGKLAGSTQVQELGTIETPIVLTNTLAVAAGIEGIVEWTLARPGNEQVRSVNAVVGETNDGGLNDIRRRSVTATHVRTAIENARGGAVEEGSVGAGTGTRAFAWKGGIGTASRRLPAALGGYTLGVLVQTNYGGVLSIDGVPIGKLLGRYAYQAANVAAADADARGDGSCMIVVATDAPLDARDLERLAARAVFGLARTGSSYSNGSGDFAIAFSTATSLRVRFGADAPAARTVLPTDGVSPLFQAALEATEEAVYNSLFKATTVTSAVGKADALPVAEVRALLERHRPR
ncbi:MAG: P1 family peptidase [Acidobacteria bacterium]|nr:P1 family peptidase [Acidobacteriota bacterium]